MGALEAMLYDPGREVLRDGARDMAPRPVTAVSAWADRNRVLTSEEIGRASCRERV